MKPIKEYNFRLIDGIFKDVMYNAGTLADVLSYYDIIIDDRCQFARLYDYELNLYFVYRAYNYGVITLTIFPLNTK